MRVQMCGRLQVEWDGQRLEEALVGRQIRLLFAYLTLHRQRPVRRDELIGAVWADEAPVGGDALLRPLLSRLRRALGPERLVGRTELAVRFPTDAWVDVEAVHADLDEARARLGVRDHAGAFAAARRAVDIADRGLLPGLEAPWLDSVRTELDDLRVGLLEAVACAGVRLGPAEVGEAERAARRVIELSPYRESARAALIEVLRRRGNVGEALLAYEDIRGLLREELGSQPGPELRALHTQLLRNTAASPAGADHPGVLPDRLAQAAAAEWVGRGDALAQLRARATAAANGTTELVLVTGDGGIGKTRLVAELASSLEGFDVLYGRCDEEQLFPYGPWVEMLRPVLGRRHDEALVALLGTAGRPVVRLLPELRDRLPDLADGHAGTDPDTERRHLFAAIAHVVAGLAAHRPVLMIMDDLHWADRSSLQLARHVAGVPRLGPVLLIGTLRDTELNDGHPLPELIVDLERHREVSRVHLRGMDESEVAALIGSVHADGFEQRTARAIRDETDGNPFFVKQLVRHLEESGSGLDVAETAPVPPSVRDVIARRVNRLPPQSGTVLRVAALIGRDFGFELLADASPCADDVLLDVLDAAVRGGLVHEVGAGRYSFAHALLRAALEADLSQTRRALLHRSIGEAIETRYADALDPWRDELARHFLAAGPGETHRAVGYAVAAAEQASARSAHLEAARLLSRAVALRQGQPAALVDLETAVATAEAAGGARDAARASFLRAATAARAVGDPSAFARAALGHSGRTWDRYGREDASSAALLEEALTWLPTGDDPLRVQVLSRLAVVRYFSDTPAEHVVDLAADATAMARRLGDQDAMAAALSARLFATWRPGRAEERLAIADEAVALADRLQSPVRASEAHLWRAFALLELCRGEEARVHFERHSELAEQSQDPQMLGYRDALRVTGALLVGDFPAAATAEQQLRARLERDEALGVAPDPNLRGFEVGWAVVDRGERGELGQTLPLMHRITDNLDRMPGVRVTLSWAYAQAGQVRRARAEIERLSADGLAAVPRDAVFTSALAILAHAIAELDADDLAAPLEPLLIPYRDSWVVFGLGAGTLGPLAYSLGLLQLVQRRAEAAAASFELALDRARMMGAPPYVARSQAGLARALRLLGDVDRAVPLEAEAAATAHRLGMLRLQQELASS